MPSQPSILGRDGMTLRIQFDPVENDNGPVSSYLIVVVDKISPQEIVTDYLKGVTQAHHDGLSYYITAELQNEVCVC